MFFEVKVQIYVNFPGNFVDIRFMIIAQEKISTYVDPCP